MAQEYCGVNSMLSQARPPHPGKKHGTESDERHAAQHGRAARQCIEKRNANLMCARAGSKFLERFWAPCKAPKIRKDYKKTNRQLCIWAPCKAPKKSSRNLLRAGWGAGRIVGYCTKEQRRQRGIGESLPPPALSPTSPPHGPIFLPFGNIFLRSWL